MNVDSSVNISNGHVNAVVSAGNTSVSSDVDVNNRNVQSDVQRRNSSVDAQAQVRNGNVHTEVNPHISVVNDHAQLQNLGYDESGHIGFQRQLDSDNAGDGISIETDPLTGNVVISNTQTSAEWGNIEGNIEDQTDLNNILTGLDNDITAVEDDVDNIQELIPVQATSNNQLADKDFVNSSIATSTATFRETYNVVTDLHLSTSATHQQVTTALDNTISVADNNDYCFVEIPTDDLTPTETLQVDRYKYNGSSWSFEYTLNNSGYTSAQWKAINSGITSGKVTQYDGYATSKQDTLTPGTGINIDSNNVISSAEYTNKANIDASNFTSEGTTFISNLGFPDSLRYESLSIGASGTTYTSPANGWILAHFATSGTNSNIVIRFYNNTSVMIRNVTWCNPSNSAITNMVPVSKGDIVMINYVNVNISATNSILYFLYAEGNPTPPQP